MLRRGSVAAVVVPLALVVICVLAGSASAEVGVTNPVEISPGGSITSRGVLTFRAGEGRVICNVSLSGTMVRGNTEFLLGEAIGSVNRVTTEGCRGGTITPLVEERAPWGMYIHENLGTLPESVTGISVWFAPIAVLVRGELISSCLYPDAKLGGLLGLTLREGTRWTYRTGEIRLSTEEDEWSRARKLEGILECERAPTVAGTLSLTSQEIRVQQPAQFNFAPSNYNIIYVGTASHAITFRNTTLNPIGPLGASVIHSGTRGFSITPMKDLCNGATVAGGATCTVEVTYTAPGTAPRTDLLKVMLGAVVQGSVWVRAQVP